MDPSIEDSLRRSIADDTTAGDLTSKTKADRSKLLFKYLTGRNPGSLTPSSSDDTETESDPTIKKKKIKRRNAAVQANTIAFPEEMNEPSEQLIKHTYAQRLNAEIPSRVPIKRAQKKARYYITADNKVKRAYNNRCERFCLGPLTDCVEFIGTFVIVSVNFILLCAGFFIIIMGHSAAHKSFMSESALKPFRARLSNSMEDVGLPNAISPEWMDQQIQAAALPLTVAGYVVILYSLFGLVGTLLSMNRLLGAYSRLSSLTILLLFSAFIFIYDGEPKLGKKKLLESLKSYSGVEGSDTATKNWNFVMRYFNCCGVVNYMDFILHPLPHWPPETIEGKKYDLLTPVTCCKKDGDNLTDFLCAIRGHANSGNNNMEQGCYYPMYSFVFRNYYFMEAFVILIGVNIILWFFSSWIVWSASMMTDDLDIIKKVKEQVSHA